MLIYLNVFVNNNLVNSVNEMLVMKYEEFYLDKLLDNVMFF